MNPRARTVKSIVVRRAVTAAVLATAVLLGTRHAPAGTQGVEEGAFALFKFEQRIGEEKYEIRPGRTGSTLTSTFSFADRGTTVPLTTTLQLDDARVPARFSVKGRAARTSAIDVEVTVTAGTADIREGAATRRAPAPGGFFTMAGYAPPSLQMALMRHWVSHGRPASVPLLPAGAARIERRGRDVIAVNGRSVPLDRYSVSGIIWGRETLWCDEQGTLAALVTVDAEFDHFEALRPDLAPALPQLVAQAAADGMAALAEAAAAQNPPPQPIIAIAGGTIVDMTGAPPLTNGTVLIRDGRIASVGPAGEIAVPRGAEVIDARGKTVIPGLWDMHAHFEQVEWGPIYLAAGVTTVRDVGNELEFIGAVRDAIASGKGVGPRLLLAGVIDGAGPSALGLAQAATPEDGRRWVNRYVEERFDQIKIYSSMTRDVLRAVTDEAHRHGLTVTGHVPNGMTAFDAVEAGLDQINHAEYIMRVMRPDPKRAVDFFKAHGTVVDPTLALYELFRRSFATPIATFEPGIDKVAPELATPLAGFGLPPDAALAQRAAAEEGMAAVRALHRAGVPIVAGTDQAVPGHSLHREIELYVKAGFTPLEALQAATIVPARAMKRDAESGTLEAGKRGDVLVLDADPLQDIRNTRRIHRIVVNGRIYDPAPLWRSVGFWP